MGRREPRIVEIEEPMVAAGLGAATSDKTIARDAAALGKRYAAIKGELGNRAFDPRIFIAASTDYDEKAGSYRYAMGDVVGTFVGLREEFERIIVPSGTYAVFRVRPVLGFLWAPAIGATYAYAYGKWLPSSAWIHAPGSLAHYEYHDERATRGLLAEIEIRIPVEPK
jgi:predicted transcriptional regulator YdeE